MRQARRFLTWIPPVALLCVVVWVCFMEIFDFDVWWHIQSGRVMLETGDLIRTDPFAFTREGQPYLATHEWLSQIFFALVWNASGAMGITILRILLLALSVGFVLAIDRQSFPINSIFAVGIVALVLPGMVDRPQIFSYAVFAAELYLLVTALRHAEHTGKFPLRIMAAFLLAQILWVNFHGAACVLGMILYAAYALERLYRVWKESGFHWSQEQKREAGMTALFGILTALTLFFSPGGIDNLSYLWSLLTDQTAGFISEWEPRSWGKYLKDFWIVWIVTIAALLSGKRFPVFCWIVLLALGYFSREAQRHEMLLALALFAVFILNLPGSPLWGRIREWCASKRFGMAVPAALLVVLVFWTLGKSADLVHSYTKRGVGSLEQGKGAFDFIEAKGIPGPVFNSYELGGYFLYRGYPDRKVFIDGRNVDYGYDFLKKAFDAGRDGNAWEQLDRSHDFSAAAVFYELFTDQAPFPYTQFLNNNPAWALVFLDDWTALYMKRDTQTSAPVTAYSLLTPEVLMDPDAFQNRTEAQLQQMEQELLNVTKESAANLQARLQLARLYILAGITDEARLQLAQAMRSHPHRYEPYELLGVLELRLNRYEAASDAFAGAVSRVGSLADTIDHAALADVAKKAGKPMRALLERIRAL